MPINYIDISSGIIGFTQKNYTTNPHRHFYIEVAFALHGNLRVKTADGDYKKIQSILINSNREHSFDCMEGECQLYFIDPMSSIGFSLADQWLTNKKDIRIDGFLSLSDFNKRYVTDYNNQNTPERDIDERINTCLDWMETNFSIERLKVKKISEVAFLSDSRFAHIFKEQIGISVYQYILWKKVEEAILLAQEGGSLTQSAYSLGFTDSSHLTRTFKNMFGISPSFALKR